jgi:uncharacterized protein
MIRKKVAIVGSGISGMASAWFLNPEYDITIFEKENRTGGHSNTVEVLEADKVIPIDTGFMVYNEVTYPLLTRLFKELDVATKPTCMSFSVQHAKRRLEFNGGSLNLLFGQRRNLCNLRFWKMLFQINRFNRETVEELSSPIYGDLSLSDYVRKRGYGEDFLNWYLSPMAAAVWSSPPEKIRDFPAKTLMRFWYNHGFLGLNTQHPWRTVVGGSKSYVTKLTQPYQEKIHKDSAVESVRMIEGARSCVTLVNGTSCDFDLVVMAAHGDQSHKLLEDATPLENELLSKFQYQSNTAVVHTDSSFMPKNNRCWAAWNYRIDTNPVEENHYSTHYWMNRLQGVSKRENYFVSINPPNMPKAETVKYQLNYEHPLFDLEAISVQNRLSELHQAGHQTGRFYCGAWQRYGFHEDGLWSAVNVCTEILGRAPWR